jgi:signal transduction histidine kinase/DNA-binding NarL/FixJ family response regulator
MKTLQLVIIEDEEAHLQLMKRAVCKEFPQVSIDHFYDAPSCLEAIDRLNPDLIISDYLLPGLNGLEFLQELRKKNNATPVIMITGQGDEITAVRALKSGAADYVIKSAEFFRLLPGAINKVLRERRLEDSLETSYRFLEAANRSVDLAGLIEDFTLIAKRFTGCSLAAIRIFEEGRPLLCESCEFHDREISSPRGRRAPCAECLCVDGATDAGSHMRSFYTESGCFYTNSASSLPRASGADRNGAAHDRICRLSEYESLALVPVRLADAVLGLVYVADRKKDMISPPMVEVLERAAMELGTAVRRLKAVEELRRAHEQLESRVKERTAELALANEKLRKEIEVRSRAQEALSKSAEDLKLFAYSIMHDLKSPSVAVYGLTRLFHRQYGDKVDERGRKYCEQIMRASEYCSGLIGQINTYVATKEAPLNIEPVLLSDLLRTIREEFAERLAARDIRWIQPDCEVNIRVDRLAMTRLFTNLVDNALKYGGEALSEIRIGYEETAEFCTFLVSNDGVAMKKEDCKAIFGPFQRAGTSSGVPGTGLGLNIVRQIAQRHGGGVEAEPGCGGGVVFRITIARSR